jgi:hypothetical protein
MTGQSITPDPGYSDGQRKADGEDEEDPPQFVPKGLLGPGNADDRWGASDGMALAEDPEAMTFRLKQ